MTSISSFQSDSFPLDFSILSREETVLVACSGGADSIALLLALKQAEYSCVAAHVNHSTRGLESDSDETFVRQACEKLLIPFAAARLQMRMMPAKPSCVKRVTAR